MTAGLSLCVLAAVPPEPKERMGSGAVYQCLFSQSARIGVPVMSKSIR